MQNQTHTYRLLTSGWHISHMNALQTCIQFQCPVRSSAHTVTQLDGSWVLSWSLTENSSKRNDMKPEQCQHHTQTDDGRTIKMEGCSLTENLGSIRRFVVLWIVSKKGQLIWHMGLKTEAWNQPRRQDLTDASGPHSYRRKSQNNIHRVAVDKNAVCAQFTHIYVFIFLYV